MAPSPQGTRWCFTINNPTDADAEAVLALVHDSSYLICGDEVGEQGTPHMQGYVVFPRNWRMSKLSRALPRARLALARGSSKDNQAYCSKGGKFEEYGDCPADCRITSQKNKDVWEEALSLARMNRISEIRADIQIRYIRSLERIRDLALPPPAINDKLFNLWIFGETGLGKTRWVFDTFPAHYKKLKNKWWDGFSGEGVVCIQEFSPKHEKLSEHLKEWADHYPFRCEKKGSSMEINFKVLIITSNYSIMDVFKDDEICRPLLRRFNVFHFPYHMPTPEYVQEIKDYLDSANQHS